MILPKLTQLLSSLALPCRTPNSGLGSDHAWGGVSYVFGGQINGTKILGKYPETFEHTDETNIGRGRLVPSRSWESMW